MLLEFTKMEGLGNDYIYVDSCRFPVNDPSALAVKLSDRHFGIGSDGLVLIGRSDKADFSMRMFNADGSEAQMCGNASRCIAKYVYDKGLTNKSTITLDTLSGVKTLSIHKGDDGLVTSVTVDMGTARIAEKYLELEAAGRHFRGYLVDMGNPHFTVLCKDAEAIDLERFGPAIEHHPLFPERINAEFVSILPSTSGTSSGGESSRLRVRVWERGSGITLACGTGACASVAALVNSGIASSPCCVVMDGGTLQVSCSADGSLHMTGPARTVFEGTVELSD